MAGKELKDMTLTELVIECIAKGVSYKGKDAEALRKKLSPKKPTKK